MTKTELVARLKTPRLNDCSPPNTWLCLICGAPLGNHFGILFVDGKTEFVHIECKQILNNSPKYIYKEEDETRRSAPSGRKV